MLKTLVTGSVLIQISLAIDCDSLNEDQKCQDPSEPCLQTNLGICAPENGPGCSGGSELIYCPANAVRYNIGRCGFKGCHEGSCVHNDPNIGSCYPPKNDSTCHPGTTKCVTPAPTSAPITSIELKKCAIGLGYDLNWNMQLYIYDLSNGTRYSWSTIHFAQSALFATALDRNTNILYSYVNLQNIRIIGYNIYTKQEVLNKALDGNNAIHGMDFNENDGHIYGASFCGSNCPTGNIYRFTIYGDFEEAYSNVVPPRTKAFLFSKDYNNVYYGTEYDEILKQPFGINDSDNWEILNFTLPKYGNIDTIDWYTNDPNDATMLVCIQHTTHECWTYNVETGEAHQLFDNQGIFVTQYAYVYGMEVLYDEFQNCEYALSTCPIKIDVKKSSECTVIIKVLNSNCACIDDIEYIEIIPSNISPVKLTQSSWEEVDGQYWVFDSIDTGFEGPFGIKIGKTEKELHEANIFNLNEKNIYEIQGNLCD